MHIGATYPVYEIMLDGRLCKVYNGTLSLHKVMGTNIFNKSERYTLTLDWDKVITTHNISVDKSISFVINGPVFNVLGSLSLSSVRHIAGLCVIEELPVISEFSIGVMSVATKG